MAELSKFQTIAPSWQLVPAEIDKAVIKRFGQKQPPREPQVFGKGVEHAFADKELSLPDFSGVLTPEEQHQFKEQLDKDWQLETLRGT